MNCYRCRSELPTSGSNCPSCGQAIYARGVQPGQPAMGRRLDGCLPEAPGAMATAARATPNLDALPRQVDLRQYCSPVEDQGQVGSCTANAVVGAMEYQIRKEGKPAVDLSRLFVYFNARRMSGHEGADCGTRISQGLAAFMAFGSPPEAAWPYDPNLVNREPGDAVFQQARDYVPAEYAHVDGFDNVRGALARGYPVVFAASLPESFWNAVRATGRAAPPSKDELMAAHTNEGTHAMLLVGYDDGQREVLIRNSWGEGWGEKGYFRLDYDSFTLAVGKTTQWILGKLEASGAFKIDRPAVKEKPVDGGVKDLAAKLREDIRGSLEKDIKDAFKDVKDRLKPR